MIEVVAGIERGVSQKLEKRSMQVACSGSSQDVCIARCATTYFSRHDAGRRFEVKDRVYVEIGERPATHFRVTDVRSIESESCLHTLLAVDRELLGEV
jgi:hypothetical protein